MSNFSDSQEMILRLKTEEFTLWRQTMTLSAGFIGFSATLLGTKNLPSINITFLFLSWVFFMINIILGTLLMKRIITLNINASWFSGYRSTAQTALEKLNQITSDDLLFEEGHKTHQASPKEFEDYKKEQNSIFEVTKRKGDEATKKLGSNFLDFGIKTFFGTFAIGLIFLALSVMVSIK